MRNNNTNTKEGFTIPNNYFNKNKTSILKSISTSNIKDDGFTTSPQYFSSSKKAILKSTINSEPISIFSKKWIFISVTIAASLILLFSISNYNTKTTSNTIVTIAPQIDTTSNNFISDETNTTKDLLLSIYIDDSYTEESIDDYALESLIF